MNAGPAKRRAAGGERAPSRRVGDHQGSDDTRPSAAPHGPMSLGARVSLASGSAVAIVLGLFGLLLHHSIQSAVDRWERENVAAMGHHAASMIAAAPAGERAATVQRLSGELGGFGVELEWARPGAAEGSLGDGAVRVPVVGDGSELRLARTSPARQTLGRRLFVLYATLLAALFVGLAIAVQASVVWGLVRPLQRIHKQIRTMRRGPWRTTAGVGGVAEVVALAREVESLGLTLDHRIPEWVEAEKKASTELARRKLQASALPDLREIKTLVGALRESQPATVGLPLIERVLAAADRIEGHLDAALEDREFLGQPSER